MRKLSDTLEYLFGPIGRWIAPSMIALALLAAGSFAFNAVFF